MTNPIALDDSGNAMVYDGKAWSPAPVAVNEQGQKLIHNGESWAPLPGGEAAKPAPTVMDRVNTGINYLGTQATKAATGFAGTARAISDVAKQAGLPPAMLMTNPITAVGQFMPSTEQMNKTIFGKFGVPEVNSGSKVLDAGVQAAMTAPFAPGSAIRNVVPLFAGGAGSEASRLAAEGTPMEIPAAVVGGLASGIGTAGIQNFAGNIGQGVRNALAPNTAQTTSKIIGRALARDEMTGPQFAQRQADLGPNALAIEAGGPNMEGVLRGSIAAPGPARTTVNRAFDQRLEGADTATEGLINKTVSDLPPVSTRINALSTERSAASGPAYRAAGVPSEIVPTATTETLPPTRRPSNILGPDGEPLAITDPGKTITKTVYNAPLLTGEPVKAILDESKDVQAAISAARKLPQYKDVPSNSMIMLDKAYKHIGGMAQEATRAGNGERARDLNTLRTQLANAIESENPAYGDALRTFSEPSKLIDAATLGGKLFKGNTHPEEVGRIYSKMPADQQAEFRGGVADYLRTKIGNSDRTTAAERIWGGENNRERLRAVLGDDFGPFAKQLDTLVGAAQKNRAITSGSRTTPMALEAADNADIPNALASAARGKFGTAMAQAFGKAYGRIAEGRTERVNSEVANALTSTDPAKVGLVASLAEKARRDEFRRNVNRRNALAAGGVGPTMSLGQ